MFERIHVIVLDSVGIGGAPDAAAFGDAGADTLGTLSSKGGLHVPVLQSLGLGNLRPLPTVPPVAKPLGLCTVLREVSAGKDTMTGHWELMGLLTEQPFPVFPQGFSNELLHRISQYTGREILCNKPYSGTQVLEDYGPQQLATGALIVYTSADPVLQIAAHEQVVPLAELYDICQYVRGITKESPRIGRVIARPYVGAPGSFIRTAGRHDYALRPHGETVLDKLCADGLQVVAVGKINDIFSGQGITRALPTTSNAQGMTTLWHVVKEGFKGISFTNLVDFDALYGHRRDIEGYARALEDFDTALGALLPRLGERDLVAITADHGNDPGFTGTDHTREQVPLLLYSPTLPGGVLPVANFAALGATIAHSFGVAGTGVGKNLLA